MLSAADGNVRSVRDEIRETIAQTQAMVDQLSERIASINCAHRPTLTLIQGDASTPSGGWRDKQQAS